MTRCPVEKNRNNQNRLEKILYILNLIQFCQGIQKRYLIFFDLIFNIYDIIFFRKKRIFHLKSHQNTKNNIYICVEYHLRNPKKDIVFLCRPGFMILRHNNVTEHKSDFFCKQLFKKCINTLSERNNSTIFGFLR